MSGQFFIIWPERRTVTAERILTWYSDALANRELDSDAEETQDPQYAAQMLDEAGLITLGRVS